MFQEITVEISNIVEWNDPSVKSDYWSILKFATGLNKNTISGKNCCYYCILHLNNNRIEGLKSGASGRTRAKRLSSLGNLSLGLIIRGIIEVMD